MKKQEKKRILFLMQLPPPVHGVSVINETIISNSFFDSFDKKIISLRFSKSVSELRKFNFTKIIKTIIIWINKTKYRGMNAVLVNAPEVQQ